MFVFFFFFLSWVEFELAYFEFEYSNPTHIDNSLKYFYLNLLI